MSHGYLQHGVEGNPMLTEVVIVKQDVWPNAGKWLAYYEKKWRRVHVQVKRTFIVYNGEKITIKIDGV